MGGTDTNSPEYLQENLEYLQEDFTSKVSKMEDKMILNEVKIYGSNNQTLKDLATKLSRSSYLSIKSRLDTLTTSPSKSTGKWSVDDDNRILEILFKVSRGVIIFHC